MISKITKRVPALSRIALAASFATMAWTGPAHAELGGGTSSVQTDGLHMKARIAATAMGNYTRHALTRDNGGMVHEFTNAQGKVFAVTWSGPGKPDLRALLGSSFTTFQGGARGRGGRLRGPRPAVQVSQSDLKIQTSGHMGWFHGVAYIPSLAPAGFSTSSLPDTQ